MHNLYSRRVARFARIGFLAIGLIGLALLLSTTFIAHAKPKTIIMVTSLGDGAANATNCPHPSNCRLRDAIAAANSGDEIQFGAIGTITLVSPGELAINKNLSITGPAGGITISGDNTFQVFNVLGGKTLTLQNNLTVANGSATGNGGGILVDSGATLNLTNVTVRDNQTSGYGGGIYTNGTIVLNNVTIHSNRSTGYNGNGGGIFIGTTGTATLTNVTVRDNQCTGTSSNGGGIANLGQLTLSNSAVTGNSAENMGGIHNGGSSANAILKNVTISGNTCSAGTSTPGCGFASHNSGTATLTNVTIAYNNSPAYAGLSVWNGGSATLRNTIVANNTEANCSVIGMATLTSDGYNLSSDTTCNAHFTQASDLNNTAPRLAALALNSPGTTKTHALLAGSPAIDKVPSAGGCGASVTTDQRGVARPQNLLCDIGAYEYVPPLFLPLILR